MRKSELIVGTYVNDTYIKIPNQTLMVKNEHIDIRAGSNLPFEPIALNPHWWRWLGFKMKPDRCYTKGDVDVLLSKEGWRIMYKGVILNTWINSVHELQNVYYICTGKRLLLDKDKSII